MTAIDARVLGDLAKAGVADLRADRDRARTVAIALEGENEHLRRLLYDAWVVIANGQWVVRAHGPDQWTTAAIRWRDAWHAATMHPAAADQQAEETP